nr:hypothetical protein [Xylophilus sp.]
MQGSQARTLNLPSLGRDQAAGGVDARQFVQFGKGEALDACAALGQALQRLLEGGGHGRLQPFGDEVVGHVQPQAGGRHGPGVERLAAQHGVEDRAAPSA